MLKSLGKRKPSRVLNVAIIAIIGSIVWSQREQLGQLQVGGLGGETALPVPLLALAGFTALILFLRHKQYTGHVDQLAYGITDRRVLILHKGKVLDERSPDQMKWVELRDRPGAEGYSDIIWETRRISTSTGDSQTTALEREQARVGFKALREGRAVFERIERWRASHGAAATAAAKATVGAMTSEGKEGSEVPRLAHPRLGLSIATPAGWSVSVRKKTFPFGKTRIDLNAEKWHAPQDNDKWNVIRLNDGANAEVAVEAVMSDPVATFEAMADPALPDSVNKVMKVVDTAEHVNIGGIDGFRVDMELSGKGDSHMSVGESSDKVQSIFRQYVLHDGAFQYHITASWPRGGDAQAAACQAIIDSFKGCSAIVA